MEDERNALEEELDFDDDGILAQMRERRLKEINGRFSLL